MSVPTLPTVDPNATLEELRNQVAILQKTITFYLTSNLSSDNAYEFGGWLIGADSLMSDDGSVGLSSAITGADDIRIWAGDSTIGSSPFRVYESGHVYASNLTMVGGSIDWGAVIKPNYTAGEVGAVANNRLAVFNTLTDNGTRQGLFLDVGTGELYMNATYIKTGTLVAIDITGTNITGTSTITGATISGGTISTANNLNVGEDITFGNGGANFPTIEFIPGQVRISTDSAAKTMHLTAFNGVYSGTNRLDAPLVATFG